MECVYSVKNRDYHALVASKYNNVRVHLGYEELTLVAVFG